MPIGQIAWNKGKTGIYSKETLEKMRVARLGKKPSPMSPEQKEALRKANLGNKNWLGRKHTPETITKILQTKKEKYNGDIMSKEARVKTNMMVSIKNRKPPKIKIYKDRACKNKGLSFAQIYGEEKTNIIKHKMSLTKKGIPQTTEHKAKRAESKKIEVFYKNLTTLEEGVIKGVNEFCKVFNITVQCYYHTMKKQNKIITRLNILLK